MKGGGAMQLGLVFDLRSDYAGLGLSEVELAEFDSPATIAAIAAGLEASGVTVERVGNARALAKAFVEGRRFDLVFSIAEGLKGRSREAQAAALCELYDQPYVFSDPLTLAATLDKAVAKRLARDQGVPTAPFALLREAGEARSVDLGWPVFVKPVAEGTGKGVEAASKCADAAGLETAAGRLIARFSQPALVEPFLPGREFTVGVVGTGERAEVVAVMEITLTDKAEAGVYSYTNKEDWRTRVRLSIAQDAEAKRAARAALQAHIALECRDGARYDFRSDASGRPMFLEVNPLAGLNPDNSDLPLLTKMSGRSYEWLLARILMSACERHGLQPPPAMARLAAAP